MSEKDKTESPPSPAPESRPRPAPEDTARWYQFITLPWAWGVVRAGAREPLTEFDLFDLGRGKSTAELADRLLADFEKREAVDLAWNASLKSLQPTIVRRARWLLLSAIGLCKPDGRRQRGLGHALFAVFGLQYWWYGAGIYAIWNVIRILLALVSKWLIRWCTQAYYARHGIAGYVDPPLAPAIVAATVIALSTAVGNAAGQVQLYNGNRVGVLARSGLIGLAFRKSRQLSDQARLTYSDSRILALVNGDADRVRYAAQTLYGLLVGPTSIAALVPLLLILLGPSSLVGLALIVATIVLQRVAAGYTARYRRSATEWADKRLHLTQEILGSAAAIKLQAWEQSAVERIQVLRNAELKMLRRIKIVDALIGALYPIAPILGAVVSIVVYSSTHGDGTIDNDRLFTAILLLAVLMRAVNTAYNPLAIMLQSLRAAVDLSTALARLNELMRAETRAPTVKYDASAEFAVSIRDGTFRWTTLDLDDKPSFELSVPKLSIARGELVAVVGQVGTGKSALCNALLDRMAVTSGSITLGGRNVAFDQRQYILSGQSIRDQITLGGACDEVKLREVLHATCLDEDLRSFASGVETLVGERGVSLSGGQAARVCLARMLYHDGEIIIIDDALSALDARTVSTVFERAIVPVRGRKTVILVTHALHLLSHHFDRILFLGETGRITENGAFDALVQASGDLAQFVRDHQAGAGQGEVTVDDIDDRKTTQVTTPIMLDDYVATGGVGWTPYGQIIRIARAPISVILIVVGFVGAVGSQVIGGYALVWWQTRRFPLNTNAYIALYTGLSGALIASMLALQFALVALVYSASKRLHSAALARVVRAPVSFFATTPIGRLVARFSSDLAHLDSRLADDARYSLNQYSTLFTAVAIVASAQPYSLIAVFFALLPLIYLGRYYLPTMRGLRRLDNTLNARQSAILAERLAGLETLRMFGRLDAATADVDRTVDLHSRAEALHNVLNPWIGLWVNNGTVAVMLAATLLTVFRRYDTQPAVSGLAIAYIGSAQYALTQCIRTASIVENDVDATARVLDCLKTEQEAADPGDALPPEWPSGGKLEFRNVSMRYRPELPLSLTGVSFSVSAGEKIGIIGRTGAGKSSLLHAMVRRMDETDADIVPFRMSELANGSITLDGIDLARVGLTDLRRRVSVLPQRPLILRGTIRQNLDPFGEHSDPELNDALRRSHLLDSSSALSLDSPIETDGANLALGEAALLSLARALVQRSKLVVLDECSARVDPRTDARLQETIAAEFRDCTILAIAHRLRTVIGFDRFIVMSDGRVAEIGTPIELFERRGAFHEMAMASGIDVEDLHRAASSRP